MLLLCAKTVSAQPTDLQLPFMAGDDWWCAQGWNGTTSHDGEAAWDYNYMGGQDLGYPVVASGSGQIVFSGRAKKSDGSNSPYGNVVLNSYGSGYYGRNAHLVEMIVQKGEYVFSGQAIGLCGGTGVTNTQWSPHIHCDTQRTSNPAGKDYTPVYVLYKDKDGNDHYGYPEPCNCTSHPGDKHYISRNAGVFDRAEAMFPEVVNLIKGRRNGKPRWYSTYDPNQSQNVYVQEYTGGSQRGIIIYDALHGARWAVPVAAGFYGAYASLRGPQSDIGNPTGPEYLCNGGSRQETQYGCYTWTSSTGVHAYKYPGYFGVGVYNNNGKTSWNVQKSYLFAQAHYRNGAAKMVGTPNTGNPGVHSWDGKYDVQDFRGGQYGDCMLVYDPNAKDYPTSVYHYTDWYWPGRSGYWDYNQQQVYLVRGAIRTYWISHRDALGAPITDEYPYGSGRQCQRFIRRNGSGWLISYVVWYGGSTVKVPTIVGMKAADVDIEVVDDTQESPAPRPVLLLTPNPTAGSSTIQFSLPAEGQAALQVFDVAGRLVATLMDETRPRGEHQVSWDGKDGQGNAAASGIYFVRLATPSFQTTKRLVVLR